MSQPADPSGLGRMLSEVMAALGDVQNPYGAQEVEPAEGEGQAASGMIRAHAVPPGRIDSLIFDPRVMRMPSEAMAEEVVQAVNQALADLQEKAAVVSGQIDFDALDTKLREIQADTGRHLAAFTNSLVEVQERIARQGGKG